ncbi:MAG: hypothetical protein AAFU78_07990 [Cyanobacteria bacterium J06633_2]
MGRTKHRDRHKPCSICSEEKSVLFRVQIDTHPTWHFVCEDCLKTVKSDNPNYIYGGTWKAQKR